MFSNLDVRYNTIYKEATFKKETTSKNYFSIMEGEILPIISSLQSDMPNNLYTWYLTG